MNDSPSQGRIGYFSNLSRDDVKRLAINYGLSIDEGDVDEVRFRLIGLAEALSLLDPDSLKEVDPLPILYSTDQAQDE